MEIVGSWLQEILLPGLGTLVLGAVLSLVRRYIARLDDERLQKLLLALVRAAEQIYGPGSGEAKRQYVMQKLREYGVSNVDREMVEAAVYAVDGDSAAASE